MKMLVIGGTRLLGLATVRRFLESSRHVVTVLSRSPERCPPGAKCLALERTSGLSQLQGESFDAIIDFVAYDGAAVADALLKIPRGIYVLVSSAWLPRLQPGIPIDQPITAIDQSAVAELPILTRGYLLGKCEAEAAVLRARAQGRAACALRLPIFLGEGDHTGRVGFYQSRIADGGPILCVDGGHNMVQIAWTEDIATSLVKWLPLAVERPVWEGLADAGLPARDVIGSMARQRLNLIDVPSSYLKQRLPIYLDHEPFWRESALARSPANVFLATDTVVTPVSEWLCKIRGGPDTSPRDLRDQELELSKSLRQT